MTRLLVIGSSHVGALKNAQAQFLAPRPQMTLDFFGLRGPSFLKSRVAEDGVFHPPITTEEDRALILKANGTDQIDTTSYDHVLLIGYRFGFPEVASLLEHHDIQGWEGADRAQTIDLPLAEDMVDTMIDSSLTEVLEALAPAGRPLTLCLAPYPAKSIASRARKMELARELKAFWTHPAAEPLFQMWHSRLLAKIEAAGHRLLPQPRRTMAGPFATKPKFAKAPENLDGSTMKGTDHRHMNADFGLLMLTNFARMLKNTSVAARPVQTPMTERI